MSTPKSRRSPMSMMDPETIVPTARFQRNRSSDQGASRFVIVDHVETLQGEGGSFRVVHYHCEATGRKGEKLMTDFCRRSEFIPAPPWPPPPPVEEPAPVANTPEDTTIEGRLAALEAGQKELRHLAKQGHETLGQLLDILKRAELGPLFQRK